MDRSGSPGCAHSDEEAGEAGQGWPLGLRRVSMRMKNVSEIEFLDVTSSSTSSRSSSSTTNNYGDNNNNSHSRHNNNDIDAQHNYEINSTTSSCCFPSSSSSSSFSSPSPHLRDNESTTSIFPDVRSITLGYLMGMSGRAEGETENVGRRSMGLSGRYNMRNEGMEGEEEDGLMKGRCVIVGDGRQSGGGRILMWCRLLMISFSCGGLQKCLSGGGGVHRWASSSSSSSSSSSFPSSRYKRRRRRRRRRRSDHAARTSDSLPSSSTLQIYHNNCGDCCFHLHNTAADAAAIQFNNCSSSSIIELDSSIADQSMVSPPPSDSPLPHSLADFLAVEKRAEQLFPPACPLVAYRRRHGGSLRTNDDCCCCSSMEEEAVAGYDDDLWKPRKKLFSFGRRSVALWTRVHVNILYEEEEDDDDATAAAAAMNFRRRRTEMGRASDAAGEVAVDREKKATNNNYSWRKKRRYRSRCVIVNNDDDGRRRRKDDDDEEE